jgi:hypothetical protein
MRRVIDVPAPLTLALDGTARLNAGADDALLDRLLGEQGRDIASVRSTEHLPGAINTRGSRAVDGSTRTAWSTPFVGIAGQSLDIGLTSDITLDSLDLDIVTDNHHSQPRLVTLRVGANEPVQLSLPSLPATTPGSTTHVSLPLPRPLRGDHVQLTIDGYDARTTPDWYTGDAIDFPVAIAEIALPVAPAAATGTSAIDTGCRDDLVTVDGTPLRVRITGDPGSTRREALTLVACDRSLSLTTGRHEIATAVGLDSGFDIDRLVLRTAAFDSVPPPTRAAPAVRIDSKGTTSVKATVESDGEPFWLVLDQSINDGWHLQIGDAAVDGPHPVDSFANGWLVTPDHAGTLMVHVRWTPQRGVVVALVVSSLAVLACLALAVRRPWRSIERGPDQPRLAWPVERNAGDAPRPGRASVVVALIAGALFVHPLMGVAMGALFALRRRWPAAGGVMLLAVPAAIALAALQVLVYQTHYRFEPAGRWPEHFAFAHVAALSAVIVLGLLATPRGRREHRRRSVRPGSDA